ncbi:MAG: O-linked N-acetylglucosamine transferase, SPINDLY family protein [Metallibacterium sp.]
MSVEAELDALAQLLQQGQPAAAETRARALRRRWPRSGEAARLHGVALLLLQRDDDAVQALRAATRLAPQNFAAWLNLASAALATGDVDGAAQALDATLKLDPAHPAALNQLGSLRRAQGDLDAAAAAYAQAFARSHDPGSALNLAAVELQMGAVAQAEQRVRAVLQNPQAPQAEAALLLAQVRAAQRDWAGAEATSRAGLAHAPGDARLHLQAGLMAEEQQHIERAAAAYRAALACAPGDVRIAAQLQFAERQCCDWRAVAARGAWLRAQLAAGAQGIAPFAFLAEDATPADQRRCAEIAAQALAARLPASAPRLATRSTATPLRVGFVAAGFHQHATALLVTPLLETLAWDASLRLHLYALSPDDASPWRVRLAACAPLLDASAMPSAQLAQRIRGDAIDVLLDLDVWCGGGRPELFARHPAPLQVNWLGYPGSACAPWYDYLIADAFVVPAAQRAHYSESVARLPRCYQPIDAARVIIAPPPRATLGLPAQGTVFASFCQGYKLAPQRYASMLAILRAVPGSVLWLLQGPDDADARLRATAAQAGIDAQRLVFATRRAHAEYLGLYRHADLVLDTHPYNAHTSASDALYAGCPVLTCPGETFAARVAGSLNHHLGLSECNARDEADFIARAIALGRDADARAALRDRLAQLRARTSLFDTPGYARDFTALLHAMHARAARGLAPTDLEDSARR